MSVGNSPARSSQTFNASRRVIVNGRVCSVPSRLKRRPTVEVQSSRVSNRMSLRVQRHSRMPRRLLFPSLVRGRDDVFPRRWENAKTGKAGYAPACHNEWFAASARNRRPCSNARTWHSRRVADEVVRSHQHGRDVAQSWASQSRSQQAAIRSCSDETGWFLAADFDKPKTLAA